MRVVFNVKEVHKYGLDRKIEKSIDYSSSFAADTTEGCECLGGSDESFCCATGLVRLTMQTTVDSTQQHR